MGSDLSRVRHNPLLDLAGVELQQGRVALDGDFNELVAVVDRRLRALASDVLGRSTVSQTTPDAFKITVPGGALQIGRGRLYVDGLLAENHGAATTDPAKKRFDALMAEPAFADSIAYAAQPYLPTPPPLPGAGKHLVYLDVWQREVTHLEQPDLVETAIGVDTSSRLQTVWQVRVLGEEAGTAVCGSADGDIAGWAGLIAPSSGRLTTGTFEAPLSTDPCELPPSGGYRGLENQTYRVEIQDPGQPGGTATFKWSRDNASVGSRVTSMVSSTELELQTLGRDDVLRFSSGDWVEILDDAREFSQRCGELRRITVNEAARRITFAPALPADMVSPAFPDSDGPRERNLRVRRWDQKGQVLAASGSGATSVVQDLNAPGSTGAIGVPAAGTTLLLENGVTVRFSSAGAKGFRAGDFWIFVARTADASVESLDEAPPRGVHHHYARLGIWDVAAGDITDCRTPWPPRGEGNDCSCTECVTPESHASGALTIQAAVDRIRLTGGTVCLTVGQYPLREPVRIAGARSVRIKGQGTATVIAAGEGVFTIRNGLAVTIEDVTVVSLGGGPAIGVRTVLGLTLQRLLLAVLGAKDASASAIALAGAVIGATIRDNAILAPSGVRVDAADDAKAPPVLLSAVLRIEDNVLWCERQGVSLEGRVMHMMSTRITGNELLGCRLGGIVALGLCGAGASMRIGHNSLNVSGPGISAAVDGLWIEENKVTAAPQSGNRQPDGAGISVRTGLDPTGVDQCHIRSNQIAGFPEAGIALRAPIRSLIVALNSIERCGDGVVSQDDARAASVSIEHNHIADLGVAGDVTPRSVVAIGLLRAGAATVAGNIIRRVGLGSTQAALHAGIAAVSVERLRASGNDITGVAPVGEFLGIGAGVIVGAPYVQAEITLNHVDRDEAPSAQASKSTWFAVLVGQPNDARPINRAGAFTTVSLADGRTLVVGAKRPFLVAAPAAFDQASAASAAFTQASAASAARDQVSVAAAANQPGVAAAALNQAGAEALTANQAAIAATAAIQPSIAAAATQSGVAAAAFNQPGTAAATANEPGVAAVALDQAGTPSVAVNQAVAAASTVNQAAAAAAALNQAVAVAARGSSLSVLGNVLAARGSTPAVQLTATEDCLFSDNRCELRGSAGVPPVRILSAATVVNANRVRGTGAGASIHLLGNAKSLTVVGNITTGPIIVGSPNSAPLSAPWDVLNIRS